ncbi:helix-turn-helix domain-containing protein [Halorientalis brevis]|uniref:Helix-turn-helix domain-containing protein n=1 Tax=Halorientalis brevis TaxID=1126241 RepID=A0ABD6C6R1_9EURY|nr:helix-turn-helix domain-containing protein [Halorientalis brevis]
MCVIAEFTLPHRAFALAETFSQVPGLVLEAERTVAHASGSSIPFLWAVGTAIDVERELDADPTTRRVACRATSGSGALYEIEWVPAVERRIGTLIDADVTVLTLVGRATGWTFRVRATDHETLAAYRNRLREATCSVTLDRLRTPESPVADGQFLLTDKQREALVAAQQLGYFDVPRETTLSELADELGISQQALSKRLRRAQQTITRETLAGGRKQQQPASIGR